MTKLEDLVNIMEQMDKLCPRAKVPASIHVDEMTFRALALLSVASTSDETVNKLKDTFAYNIAALPIYKHDEWKERKVEVRNVDGEVIHDEQ